MYHYCYKVQGFIVRTCLPTTTSKQVVTGRVFQRTVIHWYYLMTLSPNITVCDAKVINWNRTQRHTSIKYVKYHVVSGIVPGVSCSDHRLIVKLQVVRWSMLISSPIPCIATPKIWLKLLDEVNVLTDLQTLLKQHDSNQAIWRHKI